MRRMLGLLLAATPLLIEGPALIADAIAAPSSAAVLSALTDASGWAHHADHKGITVYQKHISIVDMPAFKGVTVVDVDRDVLWGLICDVENHKNVSEVLDDSKVVGRVGSKIHYYQVTDTPALMPISDRYWFNEAHELRDYGGPGHHRRTWSPIDPNLYPETYAAISAKYPDAVYITTTYGYWEVEPMPEGKTKLTYTSLTDPGGSVPSSVFEVLSARSLPDNMMIFIDAARARSGG